MSRRPCVGVTVILWGGLYAQKQPFKTEFPSIMTLQLIRNFSTHIPLIKLFVS